MDSIKNEVNSSIGNSLSDYNSNILNVDNPDITVEVLDETFDELQDSIATDAASAVSGDFVGISDNVQNLWTDGKLKFTKDEATGAYLIEQLDENGNWVAMGWTTEEAVQDYLEKVNSLVGDDTVGGDDSLEFREMKEQQLEERHSKEGSNNTTGGDDSLEFREMKEQQLEERHSKEGSNNTTGGDDSLNFREIKEQQLEERHTKESSSNNTTGGNDSSEFREIKEIQLEERHSNESNASVGERTANTIQDKYSTAKDSQLNEFDERDSVNPLTQALNDTRNGNINISQYTLDSHSSTSK